MAKRRQDGTGAGTGTRNGAPPGAGNDAGRGAGGNDAGNDADTLRYRSPRGRWALAAVVLGSGAVFVESSVVSVAIPAISRDLKLNVADVQWVLDGYLLALSALIILGGALGDRYGRRKVFVWGLIGFAAASALCGIAPNTELLIAARVLQGIAGAAAVPASLAIVEASFAPEDRGAAIGAWSGFSGISAALGPFLGGYLVDAGSWRLVFLIVVVLALLAALVATRHIPETRDPSAQGTRLDYTGAALVSLGLAGTVAALIEASPRGLGDPVVLALGLGGIALLVAFIMVERRVSHPMLPLGLFRSRQFTGANLATLANYFALGGNFFFLSIQLQTELGYSALAAGAAGFPATLIMLVGSPRAGALAQRIGPRWPMTIGPLVAAVGFLLLSRAQPGASYVTVVLPAILVFGVGITIFVAPLTAAVLAAVDDQQAGIASAVNNAAARTAQLLAAAILPLAAGLGGAGGLGGPGFAEGFRHAMWICAGVAVAGSLIAWATIRTAKPQASNVHPSMSHGCSVDCPEPAEAGGGRR